MITKSEGRIILAAWILLAFALLVLPGKHGLTGFVVYQGDEKGHSFSLQGMSYNASLVDSSGNSLRLMLISEIRSYDTMETSIINVSSAIAHGKDVLAEIRDIDSSTANVDKSKSFDVIFNDNLYDDQKIQFYIRSSSALQIYLCNMSQECESPGYGMADYDGGTGYYNLTISGLDGEANGFNIDPPAKISFDHIRAVYEFNLIHDYEYYYYPLQAIIETGDFMPSSLYAWSSISADEELNGQTMEYYYSTDSGATWSYIDDGGISDADASSGKIRMKVLLTSDSTATPVLRNLSISYSEGIVCNPEWQQDNNTCADDDSRLVTYTDVGSCNTTESLPADNGTYAYCDCCTPEWQEINTSCLVDDIIEQYFADMIGCYGQTGLEADNSMPGNNTYACDYCTPVLTEHNTTCDGEPVFTNYYADASDCYGATGLLSDILPANTTHNCTYPPSNTSNSTQPNVTNATGQTAAGASLATFFFEDNGTMTAAWVESALNITQSDISFDDVEINTSTGLLPFRKINLSFDSSIISNITGARLRFYYNDSMLDGLDMNESTLRIYYYDEDEDELEEMPFILNMSSNYAEANLTHLSVYCLYGKQNNAEQENAGAQPPSSPASGGGRRESSEEEAGAQAALPESIPEQNNDEAEQNDNAAEKPEAGSESGNSGVTDELSFGPQYDYMKNTNESMFVKIGKTINSRVSNRDNMMIGAVIMIAIIIIYVVAETRAKKGYIS